MSTKDNEVEDVLIQVRGGIAELVYAPENVNVVIHDLDDCEDDEWRREHCTICAPDVPVAQGEPPTLTVGKKIPRLRLWRHRYSAYRHKYGRWLAFWRGVVLLEMYTLSRGLMDDEKELFEHLFTIEVESVEVVFGGPDAPDQEVRPGE